MARVKREVSNPGHAGSPQASPGAPPWSADDMRRAQPLPLPDPPPPDPAPAPVEPGATHAGRGEVKPGGPPEP